MSARNWIETERNWRSNGVGFEFGGGREREYENLGCLPLPCVFKSFDVWYERIPPIPGASALELRRLRRYGRMVRPYPLVLMVVKLTVFHRVDALVVEAEHRLVRYSPPVPMVGTLSESFDEIFSFSFSKSWMRYGRVVRSGPTVPYRWSVNFQMILSKVWSSVIKIVRMHGTVSSARTNCR
jgi:hypothetical protein